MAKKKPRKKQRKARPVYVAPVVPIHDAVLVAVPLAKTKETAWHRFLDWLKQ